MSEKAEILLVDGHSAIFATPALCDLHRGATRYLARLELIKELQRFADTADWHVVVVFDGKQSERGIEGGKQDGVLVMYSRDGETADTVIERLAARFGERDRVRVASNDRLVLTTSMAFGAETCSITAMWEWMDAGGG